MNWTKAKDGLDLSCPYYKRCREMTEDERTAQTTNAAWFMIGALEASAEYDASEFVRAGASDILAAVRQRYPAMDKGEPMP